MSKNIIIVILITIIGALVFLNYDFSGGKNYTSDSMSVTGSKSGQVSVERVTGGKTLDLSGQGLDKLPEYVTGETTLEVLDISNNNLTGALPAEIRHLQNLKGLDVSNNKMTGVPAEIGQLEKLETLNLSNNELTGLPYELGNLRNLKILDLSGNDYSTQDLEVIKKGLPQDTQIIL